MLKRHPKNSDLVYALRFDGTNVDYFEANFFVDNGYTYTTKDWYVEETNSESEGDNNESDGYDPRLDPCSPCYNPCYSCNNSSSSSNGSTANTRYLVIPSSELKKMNDGQLRCTLSYGYPSQAFEDSEYDIVKNLYLDVWLCDKGQLSEPTHRFAGTALRITDNEAHAFSDTALVISESSDEHEFNDNEFIINNG